MADPASAEAPPAILPPTAAAPASGAAAAELALPPAGEELSAAGADGRDSDMADDGEGGESDDGAGDLFDGRPDLSQNAIENLRAEHQRLKEQQKKVRRDMKNQKRVRSRIIKRMRHLDTASVLQVLIERGVNFGNVRGAAGVAAVANAVASAQARRAADAASAAASSG